MNCAFDNSFRLSGRMSSDVFQHGAESLEGTAIGANLVKKKVSGDRVDRVGVTRTDAEGGDAAGWNFGAARIGDQEVWKAGMTSTFSGFTQMLIGRAAQHDLGDTELMPERNRFRACPFECADTRVRRLRSGLPWRHTEIAVQDDDLLDFGHGAISINA
jgi:hypothetical protein